MPDVFACVFAFTAKQRMTRLVLSGFALCLLSNAALGITYHPRMDRAIWIADTSVLHCRLIQPIPSFGRAVFDRSAGKPLRFYLQTVSSPLAEGKAALKSGPPVWNPDLLMSDFGLVDVRAGEFPVELEEAMSTRLLAELYQGKSPGFTRRAWYVEEGTESASDHDGINVAMSSVNFREAYSLYRQCLANLIPVSFEQLARSKVQFATDKWELNTKARDWLDIIAHYAQLDPQLDQMFIDGHTDNVHTTTYNVELSRKRAEAVADYLVAKGVSRNQITIRYHGERFPLKTNNTVDGRAANRRVTIRLDRIEPSFSLR